MTTNNGGTAVLQQEINNFVGADFMTTDGLQDLRLGQTVRTPRRQGLRVDGRRRAGRPRDRHLHRPRPVEAGARHQLVPQGINFTQSPSIGIGGAVVLNDVRSDVSATLKNLARHRRRLTVSATEAATIEAITDVTGSASGGSTFTGQGTVARGRRRDRHQPDPQRRGGARRPATLDLTGDLAVTAANASAISAQTLSALSTGSSRSASCSPSTRSAGSRPTSSSPRSTRSSATR